MPNTPHRRADRDQFWRDMISAWKASGQSIRAFCAARGVSQATFYARRRELADREQPSRTAAKSASNPSFAVVRVIPDPTVEIVLPGGVVVRVPAGADPAAVARLVDALGGNPC